MNWLRPPRLSLGQRIALAILCIGAAVVAGVLLTVQLAQRVVYGVGVLGLLLLAPAGWWTGHLLTRRLARLATVAEELCAGNLQQRARLAGSDEVARVGRAFDDMAGELERHFETIRQDLDPLLLESETVNEGFILWDAEARLVRCNRRCRELLGAADDRIVRGMTFEEFLDGPVAEAVAVAGEEWQARRSAMLERHRRGEAMSEVELRHGRWLRVSKSRLPDGRVMGIYTDITETKSRELALEKSERWLRAIMDSVGEGIVVLDQADRIQVANPAAAAIFGRELSAMAGRPVDHLLAAGSGSAAMPGPGERAELVGVRADGSRFCAEVAMSLLGGSESARIATVRDVTLQKADREQILRQATHDELTGLPNRRLFDDRLDRTLRRAGRSGELVAVAFLDLDRFKSVNDSLGHAVGDRLLVALSRRLQACLRESDTVVRMGGDEFIVILPGLRRPEDALHPLRKLLESVRAPLSLDGQELSVTASVGVAVYPSDGRDREQLLRHADVALYRAKARGRNRMEIYEPSLASEAAMREQLDRDLRHACSSGELALVYQPQVNIRSGRVVGFEALLRWHHPQHGVIAPATIMPLAEETGQVAMLGLWAIERACRDMAHGDRSATSALRMAVNLPLRLLQQDDLAEQVGRILAETGLPAARLELEFTEDCLLATDDAVARTISGLQRLGVGLVLDRFGAGVAPLARVQRFPIRRLKLDPAMVRGLGGDRADAAVARAIVGLAHDLRLGIVADGVETADQLALLAGLGCEEAQGRFLAPPMAALAVAGGLRQAA